MAYDKVVDSAALDAAMTYTANRIRNKTGGTDQIAWDSAKGFGDAVDAISSGGGSIGVDENWKYSNRMEFTNVSAPELGDTFEVTLPPNQTDFSFVFGSNSRFKHFIVHSNAQPTSMWAMFRLANNGNIYTVTLDFDTSKVTSYRDCFIVNDGGGGANFTAINGVIDFTSVTRTNELAGMFGNATQLQDVTFAANTLGVSLGVGHIGNINDTSLLSLINCLKDRTGEGALTLTVASAWKTADTGRLYVSYVKLDAGTGLYVLCEQTDEGAMTMADAITSKNWTIA